MTKKHVYNGQRLQAIIIDHSNAVWELAKQASVLGGIFEESSDLSHNRINIIGAVAGDFESGVGVWTRGSHASVDIDAAGVIIADSKGIIVAGDDSAVVNNGRILSDDTGIAIWGNNGAVTNNGTVNAFGYGLKIGEDAADTLNSKVVNHGIISGSVVLLGDDGDNTFINDGTLKGSIELGGGDDVLDTRNGNLVDFVTTNSTSAASIAGGLGDDVLITGSADVFLNENNGTMGGYDWVKSTVSYSLAAHPWGEATAENVEGLALLGKNNIRGTGNGADNQVLGNAGNNILYGLAGQDRLDGKGGNDTLRGGGDGDIFVFETGGGRDKIADFDAAADHIDLSNWNALSSFSDMINHHLTESGHNLLISAGDDTLILLDVDKSALHRSDFSF